jgi:hypothetical protein
MECFPCRYGPIYHGTIFFYLKKFFVLPALPSNEKNSSYYHNSYNKGPNLAFLSFTESPFKSLPTMKFSKNHITSFYHSNMPKTAKAKIWPLKTLGVNHFKNKLVQNFKHMTLDHHIITWI